jgi:N-methylhydantoinase A
MNRENRQGPESAGAEPGPVCYGRGGKLPTLTDANLALGRIDPDYFLGGALRLDRELAMQALERHIAKPLGMGVIDAAAGIVRIADSDMASLIHNVTIGEGHDPRGFVVYAYGGLSGLHVAAFGRALGVREALVPRLAGVFSAFGICSSDCIHIAEESVLFLPPWEIDAVAPIYARLEEQVLEQLAVDGADPQALMLERSIDLRYQGQVHDVRMPLPTEGGVGPALAHLTGDFHLEYERRYGEGAAIAHWPIEIVACRVIGRFAPARPELASEEDGGEDAMTAYKCTRDVYFEESGAFIATPVYERGELRAGNCVDGPAIIESLDTNVLIRSGQAARVDGQLNLRIEL